MLISRRNVLGGILVSTCCGATASAGTPSKLLEEPFQILCSMRHIPTIDTFDNIRSARPEAVRVIQWVSNLIGMRPEFEILEADFQQTNIAIAATKGESRYVIYDAKWFVFEENSVGWYSIYILAHEIGHHIYGHTYGTSSNQHQNELDADRFGGWVVARLGGRLDQALAFMPILPEEASKTHPGRNRRIEAVREGWQAGRMGLSM